MMTVVGDPEDPDRGSGLFLGGEHLRFNDDAGPELEPEMVVTENGRRYWFDPVSGRAVPVVSGGDGPVPDDSGDQDDTDEGDSGDGGDGSGGRVFTQDEVSAAATKAANRAARRALRDLAGQHGLGSADELVALVERAVTGESESRDEVAAAVAAAERRERVARERAERAMEREVRAALTAAGAVNPVRAARLLDLDLDPDDDLDEDELAAEIEALREEMPGVFRSTTPDDDGQVVKPRKRVLPDGTPKGRPSNAGGSIEDRRAAARRKAEALARAAGVPIRPQP